jgi:hypothetical protein
MDETLDWHPWLFAVVFPLFWSAICLAIAHLGGWARAASEYGEWDAPGGARWRFQSAQFGWANYNNCLTVGAGARGIHFGVLFLFRPGHPSFDVPWEDLSVTEGKVLFTPCVELRFRRAPGVRVRLRQRLADRLQAAAGGRWPGPAAAPFPVEPR